MSPSAPPPATVRLDVWLDVACLYRTRSDAQRACRNGQVRVNGVPAKAHRGLVPGDRLVIDRPLGRTQTIAILALADRHVARAEARALYEDLTPPPTEDELARRRLERVFRATVAPKRRPDKRDRRILRGLKGA
ncbi:MAG: RNA-binding S4 domain-containing protein [Vicinamibacterales bacterium]